MSRLTAYIHWTRSSVSPIHPSSLPSSPVCQSPPLPSQSDSKCLTQTSLWTTVAHVEEIDREKAQVSPHISHRCHLAILGSKHADSIPAQQVDPASYYSFIELKSFHDDAERRTHAPKNPKSRRSAQGVDRPTSFLDLDESDARILDHTLDLTVEKAHNARVGSAIPLSLTTSNGEREQGKSQVLAMRSPGSSSCDPISTDGITWPQTPKNAPQSYDPFSGLISPRSLHASFRLEGDQLPPYEEVAASTPVDLEESTVRQYAGSYSDSSYHVDRTKVALPSSQDPISPPCNPVVVLPTRSGQRAFRPLPPIPPSKQTRAIITTPLDTRERSLHVGRTEHCTCQLALQNREDATPKEGVRDRWRSL